MSNLEVNKVLEIMEKAKARVPKNWAELQKINDFDVHLLEVEFAECKKLCDRFEIPLSLFPSIEKLEDDQIKTIVDKIQDLWAAYHYYPDLPEGLPIRIAYTTLLSVWDDEEFPCYSTGGFYFDFYELELEQYVNPDFLPYKDRDLPF